MGVSARVIFASKMVRIGKDEVGGGSAAKPLNFIGRFLLQWRSRRLGGGVKNDNLVRIGEEGGGGQAEFFGELVNGWSPTQNKTESFLLDQLFQKLTSFSRPSQKSIQMSF